MIPAMGTVFCPYRGVEIDEGSMSLEHVIPESLGGTKDFSIRTERDANNKLGTDVDGPIGDQLFSFHRAKFGLTGHSRSIPEFSLNIAVPDLDDHQGKLELGTLKGPGTVRLKPVVEREKQNDGRTLIKVSGDPDKALEIVANMKKAYEAKGFNFETHSEEVQTLQQPLARITFAIDLLVVMRFYVKLAVGVCHWLAGETWSRSEGAALLRRALWSQSLQELNDVGLQTANISPAQLGLHVEDSEHLFFLSPTTNGYVLVIFMFGGIGLQLRIPNIPSGVLGTQGIAIIMDVKNRAVRRATHLELFQTGKLVI